MTVDFLELAKSRYSCRQMTDRPVPPEMVDKILEAAAIAPSSLNQQPYRIWRMESPEAIALLRQATPFTFGAKTFLLMGADPKKGSVRSFDGRNFADVDAAIAATHMLLEIADLGLATTWVGHFDQAMLKARYPQMAGFDLIALFPIGYPAQDPSPQHFRRPDPDTLTRRL